MVSGLVRNEILLSIATNLEVSLEIIKVIMGLKKENFKNTSLNLALPQFQMFEPVGPKKFPIVGTKAFYTTWDSWEVCNF